MSLSNSIAALSFKNASTLPLDLPAPGSPVTYKSFLPLGSSFPPFLSIACFKIVSSNSTSTCFTSSGYLLASSCG